MILEIFKFQSIKLAIFFSFHSNLYKTKRLEQCSTCPLHQHLDVYASTNFFRRLRLLLKYRDTKTNFQFLSNYIIIILSVILFFISLTFHIPYKNLYLNIYYLRSCLPFLLIYLFSLKLHQNTYTLEYGKLYKCNNRVDSWQICPRSRCPLISSCLFQHIQLLNKTV